jgi:hypothetical protein
MVPAKLHRVFKRECDELKHSQVKLKSAIKGENGNTCEAPYKVN